jgi:hypothetical protein
MTKTIKVWVAKYALTDGVKQLEVEPGRDPKYVYHSSIGPWVHAQYLMGRDAFASREEAVARAEKLRDAKVASLQKQIKRVAALKFDPAP